jgi:transcriptional regulator with XRE-family HTH domain
MAAGENRKEPAKQPKLQNGSAIRDFRCKSGMKRIALAEAVGISYPHMAGIENEYNDVSYEVLYRLATALNINIRSILRNPPSADDLDRLIYEYERERAS